MVVFESARAINEWIHDHGGGAAPEGSFTALGWMEGDTLTAGLTFSEYNGAHCLVNIALTKGHFPRPLLHAGLRYAFDQLHLSRLTLVIASDNLKSQNLALALGAKREATLHKAHPRGDLLIYGLFPDECRIWSRLNEKRRRTGVPESRRDDPYAGSGESEDLQLPTRADEDQHHRADRLANVE